MPFLLHELLRDCAREQPLSVAIVDPKGNELTYAALDQESDQVAQRLLSLGVERGDPVGLAFPKCTEAIVAVYGILKAGACYVPMDVFAPGSRNRDIVANTEMKVLLGKADTLRPLLALFDETDCPNGLVCTQDECEDDLRFWQESGVAPLPQVTDADLAYLLHTSGSTGAPKGTCFSHRNALTFVEAAADFFKIVPEDRLCNQAPLHFDLSVFDLFVAASRGASVALIPEYYAAFPKKMNAAIAEQGITIWNSVASSLKLMMKRGKPEQFDLSVLRAAIFSGEPMPPAVVQDLHQHAPNARTYNVYGQTEANSSLVYEVLRGALDVVAFPLGKVLPNFHVYLVGEDGTVIEAPNQRGEIWVASSSVAVGYWRDPQRSADKFVQSLVGSESRARAYRTGDLATIDSNGNFVFQGRLDNLIKTRGYRVELGEVERGLEDHAFVELAACIAVPDEELGNRLIAFATPAEGKAIDAKELLADLGATLPKYMVPSELIVVDDFPRTSTNKIDRKKLAEMTKEPTS